LPLIQLLYRTTTIDEYKKIRDHLKSFCREFVETDFNGRLVSILILKKPLKLGNNFSVDMIELTTPRRAHIYPSGLESIGIFVGDNLSAFKKKYKSVLTGVKDHGVYCKPAFITFDNGKTVKFYDVTLKDIILREGWYFERVDLPWDAEVNKLATLINRLGISKISHG
jgi:predicted metalloenzyme YecM